MANLTYFPKSYFIDPHPLTADKGQILSSEKLPVPQISLFLISNINLVYEKCPEYVLYFDNLLLDHGGLPLVVIFSRGIILSSPGTGGTLYFPFSIFHFPIPHSPFPIPHTNHTNFFLGF